MKVLANGWVLVAHKRDVVLAMSERSHVGVEYAVWTLDLEGNTIWGTYTESLRNACDQFYWKLENRTGPDIEPKLEEEN